MLPYWFSMTPRRLSPGQRPLDAGSPGHRLRLSVALTGCRPVAADSGVQGEQNYLFAIPVLRGGPRPLHPAINLYFHFISIMHGGGVVVQRGTFYEKSPLLPYAEVFLCVEKALPCSEEALRANRRPCGVQRRPCRIQRRSCRIQRRPCRVQRRPCRVQRRSCCVQSRVVTCDIIDSSYLHSVRIPSRPWQGASSVPNAGERRC